MQNKKEKVAIEELEESQGYPKEQIWFRDKSDFFEEVNHEKYLDIK